MDIDDVIEKLQRYSGSPIPKILEIIDMLAEMNDDIVHLRDKSQIQDSIRIIQEKLREISSLYPHPAVFRP